MICGRIFVSLTTFYFTRDHMHTPKQKKLFEFLRQAEISKKTFSVEDAATASGLSAKSIQSYLSKMLYDKWVFKTNGRLETRGILSVSEAEFVDTMSQNKTVRSIKNYTEWRKRLQQLVEHGVENGFPVGKDLKDIASTIDILPEQD